MNNLEILMNKGRRACAAILGLAAISMFLAPYQGFFAGVLFGLSIGYVNFEILYNRVGKSSPEAPSHSLRLMRTGSGLRFSFATLGAMAIIKLGLAITGYIIGLIIPLILFTMIFVLQDYKQRKGVS